MYPTQVAHTKYIQFVNLQFNNLPTTKPTTTKLHGSMFWKWYFHTTTGYVPFPMLGGQPWWG